MSGKTYNVSTAAELDAAIRAANGGDTILLAPGDYGSVSLSQKAGFSNTSGIPVTIASADPDARAVITGLNVNGAQGVTFDNLVFDYTFQSGDPTHIRPFQVLNSENITITNSLFDGDVASGMSAVDDGYGTGYGLGIRGSKSVTISDNEFTTWHRGAVTSQSQDVVFSGNDIHSIRSDGINFSEVQGVLIEGNHIHNFLASPDSTDHRDFIQFWTNGTKAPNTDIIIRGNILDAGEEWWTQSIFMRNEEVDNGRAGQEMFYRNVLIEDNTIYNGHLHGITVGETDGLTIRNNSVLHVNDLANGLSGAVSIPTIRVSTASTGVTVESNITGADVQGYDGQTGWTVGQNVILQWSNPALPNYYGNVFATSGLQAHEGSHNFLALPGSIVEQLQVGAARNILGESADAVIPLFGVLSHPDLTGAVVFDASLTLGPSGLLGQDDATFLWSFGDGTTATGQVVEHRYDTPGRYEVGLTVIGKDGQESHARYEVGISGDRIVSFDSASGGFVTHGFDEQNLAAALSLPGSDGLRLGDPGTQASVGRGELGNFFGTDNFELSMSFKGTGTGEIVRLHSSFIAGVNANGQLTFQLFPADGAQITLNSGVRVNDGNEQHVTVRLDPETGLVTLAVNGRQVASHVVNAPMPDMGSWDLAFGSPWNAQNFDGILTGFDLSATRPDYPVYSGDPLFISQISDKPATDESGPQDNTPGPVQPAPEETRPPAPEEPAPEPSPNEPPASEDDPTQPPDETHLVPSEFDGFVFDFATAAGKDQSILHDDAHLVDTAHGQAIRLDGDKDYARIGRLEEFEQSQQIGFSVEFDTGEIPSTGARLVWNHMKAGLTVMDNALMVQVATADEGFKAFRATGVELGKDGPDSVTVLIDAEQDRLQVILNDEVVIDEQNTDLDFVGAGGYEWGWTLGTAWNRFFEGDIYDFRVSDDFDFIEQWAAPQDDVAMVA
ncbi:MAG: right-handed parallel beta-helix repeat-containing protein [Gemmobacter sp.]